MSSTFVAILMGSDSDLPVMQATIGVLKTFGIEHEVRVRSAHRTPDAAKAYVKDAEERGCKVFICAAGLAAHLAGAVAGMTTRPVIGVPVDNGPLQGHDALLSTVMMPGGIPVATVAIGKAGAKNAGLMAAAVIALNDEKIAKNLDAWRAANSASIAEKPTDNV